MPIMDGMDDHTLAGGSFGFSARRIGELAATEYTLVTIAVDETGSISGFERQMEECLKAIATACRRSPRADNLLIRLVAFASNRVREIHGFKPLVEIDPASYTGAVQPGGLTNLYDAAYASAGAMNQYGKDLTAADYAVNGILIVITDGEDNQSASTPAMVRDAFESGVKGEAMESLVTILVGVGMGAHSLHAFKDAAGFTQYVTLADADEKTLARLASFVSKSISSQSQALGSGGPSQALAF